MYKQYPDYYDLLELEMNVSTSELLSSIDAIISGSKDNKNNIPHALLMYMRKTFENEESREMYDIFTLCHRFNIDAFKIDFEGKGKSGYSINKLREMLKVYKEYIGEIIKIEKNSSDLLSNMNNIETPEAIALRSYLSTSLCEIGQIR